MKILIAEDQLGDLLVRALKVNFPNAEIKLTLDGVEGVRVYSEFKPDLVITDWNMPRLNGGGVGKKIRELNPSQKIILWSASWVEEFQGHTQYFNKIVQKDISIWDWKEIITGVMDEGLESAK